MAKHQTLSGRKIWNDNYKCWSGTQVVQPRQTSLHYKLALGKNDITSIGFGSHASPAKIKGSRYYIRLSRPIIIPIEVKHSV
jgi:hypothetical protein